MMKIKRKYILISLLIIVLSMVGCSNDDSNTTEVKMVYWPGPESEAMQHVVDEYNEGQGKEDDVSVDMLLISRDGTYEKEATMMSSKSNEVDLYFTASYIVGQHAPYLEPLDEELSLDNYLDLAVDSLKMDDETLALPMDASTHFLLYREDLMDDLLNNEESKAKYKDISKDILGNELEPKHPDEWEWDDFTAMSAFFTKTQNEDSPTKYGTSLQLKKLIMNIFLWNDVLWAEGGEWIDENGDVNINSDAGKKAMEVYHDIYTNELTSPDSSVAEFPETQAAMSSGNAAFAIQWGAGFTELNDPDSSPETAGKIGIAPIPGKKTHVQGQGVGLNKYSENKEAALKWMEYLTTEEANELYAEFGGTTAMESVMKSSGNVILETTAQHIKEYGYTPPTLAETNKILESLTDDLTEAWLGEKDIYDSLEEAQVNLEEILDK